MNRIKGVRIGVERELLVSGKFSQRIERDKTKYRRQDKHRAKAWC